MLDTNVAIHLRDRDPSVIDKLAGLDDAIVLSVVTRVELEGGVYTDPSKAEIRRRRLDAILNAIPVVAFDAAAADAYRSIVAVARYSRRKLLDRMIAAHALAHRATLVTMNADDFTDVPGLDLLAW
jgi:predicted nucleic acid-binding protein